MANDSFESFQKAGQYEPARADEMQIYDKIYTIDDKFVRKHPGGTVIKSKLGTNATQVFNEFHHRSMDKAMKWLKAMPSRPGPPQDALLDDFDKLRADLVKEGYFDPSLSHALYRVTEIVVMTVVGYWLVWQGWYWTGMLILGITSGRCGWLQHEANHNSFTGYVKLDKIIGSFFFSLGEAGSARWWISSHNRHHASPQHVGYDSDLNTLPAMAFDAVTAKMGNPSWLRYQAWTFQPSVWFVVLYWKFFLHPRAIILKRAFTDGIFLVAHYVAWYFAFRWMGIAKMIFTHLVWGSIAGSYLFTHFALSHTFREILPSDQQEDWVRAALLRTVDISNTPFVNWIMGYLNFQIEHHLFPNMPQFRQAQVQPRIMEFAKKHGLPYDIVSYPRSFYLTFKNLNDVGHGGGVGSGLKKD